MRTAIHILPIVLSLEPVLGQKPAVAVEPPKKPKKPKINRIADRCIKRLELPAQRRAATAELLELGSAAVPDLRRALSDRVALLT